MFGRIRLLIIALAFIGFAVHAKAATVLDWVDWGGGFVGSNLGPQSYTNPAGDIVQYQAIETQGNAATPAGDLLFRTPTVSGFGGDPGLLLVQTAGRGNGTEHRFGFSRGLDGASVQISDINSSVNGSSNFVDEVRVTAITTTNQVVSPTRVDVANPGNLTQVDAATFRAAPNSFAGSDIVVHFETADVAGIRVEVVNSETGTAPAPASSFQVLTIHNIVETGVTVPSPVIPEPSATSLVALGGLLCARRKRRQTSSSDERERVGAGQRAQGSRCCS